MLADLLRFIVRLLYWPIVAIGVITGIVILVESIISSKKNGNHLKLKYNLVAILLVIIAIASWVLNMGVLRYVMTFAVPIPIIYTIAFMIINNFSLSYIDKSVKLKRFVILSYITYLLGYLLLPDGDFRQMYVFFGLIHNDKVANISCNISYVAFMGNIVLLILQTAERRKLKKEINNWYYKQPF